MRRLLPWATAVLCLAAPAPAGADVFNGRIAFSSLRSDPQAESFDIFSMNPDGSDVRQLTTNPAGLSLSSRRAVSINTRMERPARRQPSSTEMPSIFGRPISRMTAS